MSAYLNHARMEENVSIQMVHTTADVLVVLLEKIVKVREQYKLMILKQMCDTFRQKMCEYYKYNNVQYFTLTEKYNLGP